jgi:hypothetical protein
MPILSGWVPLGHQSPDTNSVPPVLLARERVCCGLYTEDAREHEGLRGRTDGTPCLAEGPRVITVMISAR